MDDAEADFVIDAVVFIARLGRRFLPLYDFDPRTGAWRHQNDACCFEELSLDAGLKVPSQRPTAISADRRHPLYASYLAEAHALLAGTLADADNGEDLSLPGDLASLQFFALRRVSAS